MPVFEWPPSIKLGLALGGGGVFAFSHIGVLKVFEKEGIRISMLSAASGGSIVGALYASGMDAFTLEKLALTLRFRDFIRLGVSRFGFVKGDAIARFVESRTGCRDLGEMKTPLYILTTDLVTGQKVVFEKGPLGKIVQASCSVPGIFPPQPFGEWLLADGGIVENVPVRTLREKGADLAVGVNLLATVGRTPKLNNAAEVIIKTLHLFLSKWAKQIELDADLIIYPEIGEIRPYDFKQTALMIKEGEIAAEKALPRLLSKLQALNARD